MITYNKTLNIEEILKLISQRFPFLLIDRVLNFKRKKFLLAIKNVSFNEPFFQGHIPNKPIFPGVLILESMAQAAGILALKSTEKLFKKNFFYFVSIEKAKFRCLVKPGDQIFLKIEFIKKKYNFFKFKSIAKVKDKIVCESLILLSNKNNN